MPPVIKRYSPTGSTKRRVDGSTSIAAVIAKHTLKYQSSMESRLSSTAF